MHTFFSEPIDALTDANVLRASQHYLGKSIQIEGNKLRLYMLSVHVRF